MALSELNDAFILIDLGSVATVFALVDVSHRLLRLRELILVVFL